jgi:iron complex outermembrane receptor protein
MACRFAASALAIAAFASSAHAQDTAQPQNAAAEENLGGDGNDIVVTAQRREQRLQDVGIAVTALSAQQLERTNITASSDIVRLVPSLKVNTYSSAAAVFNIRGVSQNDYGDQQEPPVAVYQDDSYASSITLTGFPIFDTARVEVLRGPQGTLFGRNATGGAIQFISNQPSDQFGGYVKVTGGSYNALSLEGALSGPLADNLSVRLSGTRNTGGNYMKAIVPGMKDLGGQNNFALRGIAKWTASDSFSARLTLRYLKADQERQAGLYSHEPVCPNANGQGEYLAPNDTCSFWLGVGAGPGTTASGYRNDAINPQRGGNPWRTAYRGESFVNREFFGSSLRLEASLGDVDLVSVTDYQHSKKFYTEDFDATPDDVAGYFSGVVLNQYSQELRVSGKTGSNQWVVGAYGMIVNGDYNASFYQPIFNYFPAVDFSQDTKSYAFFAQNELSLSPKLKLIGGLRYWHDQRKGIYSASEAGTGVEVGFSPSGIYYRQDGLLQAMPNLSVNARDADASYSGLTVRAEIDYKPNPDVLIYLSYNRGSKSGGFTFAAATPFPGVDLVTEFLNNIPYKPETLNAYELGVKASLGRGATLNVAAFHYDYKNYQAFAQIGILQSVLNRDARVNGIEAELAVEPIEGLRLGANVSILDSKLKAVRIQDGSLRDRRLPQAPSFSGSAQASYQFAVGKGRATIGGDIQYASASCFTTLCSPVDQEPAYTVVNGHIGYDIGRLTLGFFVNNIFNEKYRVYGVDNAFTGGFVDSIYAKPRTFSISATVRFGSE